jgi:hypothetical protein
MNKKNGNNKKILADHKKVGSRFIPPMAQLDKLKEIRYANDILPEILWIGLINSELGYRRGTELITNIAEDAVKVFASKKQVNFALTSSYNLLLSEQKSKLVEMLAPQGQLQTLRKCLEPLIILHGSFPLSFLGQSQQNYKKDALIETLKKCVKDHFNKYNQPAMVAQATVMYISGITGGLYFCKGIEPPDIEKIITAPESEEGKKAAGSVRAFMLTELMPNEGDRLGEWANNFWDENYKISSCTFKWENDV